MVTALCQARLMKLAAAFMPAAAALAGCGGGKTAAPRAVVGVPVAFEATIDRSCEYSQIFNICGAAVFGVGVPAGTTLAGQFTLDSLSTPVVQVDVPGTRTVRYKGVVAEVTISGLTLSDNDPNSSYVEVDVTPASERYTVIVANGFRTGTLAGVSVDFAEIDLEIAPSRYPDARPPRTAAAFQGLFGLHGSPAIYLKHHADPRLTYLGGLAPGPRLEGRITAIR